MSFILHNLVIYPFIIRHLWLNLTGPAHPPSINLRALCVWINCHKRLPEKGQRSQHTNICTYN